MFFRAGLDSPNQIESLGEIRPREHDNGFGCEPLNAAALAKVRFGAHSGLKPTSREVRKVPCVDGSELARRIFTSQAWSVLPCVLPLGAVHMTAGHNALRGSGPSQQHAFEDAMALVGCPDRRIDRLCITCCSPSQPSHHAGYPARSRSPRKSDGFFVAFVPGHHSPGHPRNLVGERDGGDLRGAPA
jgi:hypothetical protein